MKNLTIIKAKKIQETLKCEWIKLSITDIQILFYLVEIYYLGLDWKLEWVKKINEDYIYIYSTDKLLTTHYPQIKDLRSSNYFRIKTYCDLWLLVRVLTDDWKHSYIKPTELTLKYIRNINN